MVHYDCIIFVSCLIAVCWFSGIGVYEFVTANGLDLVHITYATSEGLGKTEIQKKCFVGNTHLKIKFIEEIKSAQIS